MLTFDSNGCAINFVDEGQGAPVVLVHGFAASIERNWRAPGVIDALTSAGRRVIALDCRGHGESAKPRDPAMYGMQNMSEDVVRLMDHLGIGRASLVGYSMGGFISATLLINHPERFNSVILAGVGDGILGDVFNSERGQAIARAMEAADGAARENEIARNFRVFAEAMGNDLQALAAMQRAPRRPFAASALADVRLPVMVLIGEGDTLVGDGAKLAAAIPGARLVKVPGDHLTAVGQSQFRQAIVDFTAEHAAALA